MPKVKRRQDPAVVFAEQRERLGSRDVVGPVMGTNRISLYRWEMGIHPIPRWAFVMLGLLREKYPRGLPTESAAAGPRPAAGRSLHPSSS
jgi:hypothetical protein